MFKNSISRYDYSGRICRTPCTRRAFSPARSASLTDRVSTRLFIYPRENCNDTAAVHKRSLAPDVAAAKEKSRFYGKKRNITIGGSRPHRGISISGAFERPAEFLTAIAPEVDFYSTVTEASYVAEKTHVIYLFNLGNYWAGLGIFDDCLRALPS